MRPKYETADDKENERRVLAQLSARGYPCVYHTPSIPPSARDGRPDAIIEDILSPNELVWVCIRGKQISWDNMRTNGALPAGVQYEHQALMHALAWSERGNIPVFLVISAYDDIRWIRLRPNPDWPTAPSMRLNARDSQDNGRPAYWIPVNIFQLLCNFRF